MSAIKHDLYAKPEIYDLVFSWDPAIETEFYGDILRSHVLGRRSTDRIIVEFGCGTGRVLRMLSRLGFRSLGIDASSSMSRFAHEKGPRNMIDVVVADMAHAFARADIFAAAICTLSTFNYLSKTRMLSHLSEVRRTLLEDGVYVIDFLLGRPRNTKEEWTVVRDSRSYDTRWCLQLVSTRSQRFLETISIKSGSKQLVRSRSNITIIRRKEFYEIVKKAGLQVKNWFKPFTSQPLADSPEDGRVIGVLAKR